MNYASAVLAVMLLFSVVNWFVWARRNFTEPKIDLKRLEALTAKQELTSCVRVERRNRFLPTVHS
jgi:hypothetical protein